MPNFKMFEPGNAVYPEYSRVKTLELGANVGTTQGYFYTTDNVGRIIEPPAGGNVFFQRGIYQAMRTVPANAKAGENSAQFLASGSRCIVEAHVANLTAGDKVFWDSQDQVDLLTPANAVLATHVFRTLGRIWGIYTRNQSTFAEEDGKRVSAVGDRLVLDLGVI